MYRTRLGSIRGLLAFIGSLVPLASSLYSQQPSPATEFEVASVRQIDPGLGTVPPVSLRRNPGRVDYSYITLEGLVLRAYSLPYYRLVWPERLSGGRTIFYNISAKIPAGVSLQQLGPMLQNLLAKRLALKTHWEDRNLSCNVVTVAKTGLKLAKSKYEPPPESDGALDEAQGNSYRILQSSSEQRISGVITIGQLTAMLGVQAGRPLVDETGIEGYFDINFAWSRPPSHLSFVPPVADGPGLPSAPSGSGVGDLLPALERQLGLKATPQKLSMKVLVVDGFNTKPSPD